MADAVLKLKASRCAEYDYHDGYGVLHRHRSLRTSGAHLRWCSPGTRGTGLWRSAAPSWTFPRQTLPAAPAWIGRSCCLPPCRWSVVFRLALPWHSTRDVGWGRTNLGHWRPGGWLQRLEKDEWGRARWAQVQFRFAEQKRWRLTSGSWKKRRHLSVFVWKNRFKCCLLVNFLTLNVKVPPCWRHHVAASLERRPLWNHMNNFSPISPFKLDFSTKPRADLKALQHNKMSLEDFKTVSLICASETLPNLFFFFCSSMRSVSFCLVKGQETQLSLEQEVKIAEHTLVLSTLKTEGSLSPWLLENWSVETPAHGQVVTLFQRDEGNVGGWKGEYFIWGTSTQFSCPPPLFSDSWSLSFGMW